MSSSVLVDFKQFTWKAQAFVYGMRRNEKDGQWEPRFGGHYADRFLGHPWVDASIEEGWARDLRGHLVMRVSRLMAANKPFDDVATLMPDAKLIEHWRNNARRYREAAEWRERNKDSLERPVKGWSSTRSLGAVIRGDRPGKLSDRSRAMTGDTE